MSAPGTASAKRPRRWLAVVLSLFSSGLGHAYAGFPLRGFAIVVGLFLAGFPVIALVTTQATLDTLATTFAALAAVYV